MKQKRIGARIISLLMAVFVCVTALPALTAVAATESGTEQLAEKVVEGLGISVGVLKSSSQDTVTRDEMAVMLHHIIGDSMTIKNHTISDITDHVHAKQIQTVVALEWMVNYADGTFRPGNEVSWDSAIDSMLAMNGFNRVKSTEENTETANLRNARRIGLLDGLTPNGGAITWGELCGLFYNALDTEVLYAYSVAEKHYVNGTGETVLQHYLHLDRATGIVRSAGKYSLSDVENADWGSATIGKRSFRVGDLSAVKPLLGYEAEVFYTYGTASETIVFATPMQENQEVFSVSKNEILGFDEVTRILRYKNENKSSGEESVMIPATADVLVNGSITAKSFRTVLDEMVSGSVTAIDNNADGRAEVFLVSSRNVYIVDSVNVGEEVVYYKVWNRTESSVSEGVEKLQLKNREKVSIEDMQGYTRALSDIRAWDLIEVEKNEETDTYCIYCPFESVMGTIDVVKGSGAEQEVTVEGKSYKIASSYFSKYGQAETLNLGSTYTLKLDSDGRIAAVVRSKIGKGLLGYLINTAVKSKTFSGGEGQLKILTSEGQIQVFAIDKATVDEVSYKNGEKAVEAIENAFSQLNADCSADVARLIIYEVDEEQKVTSVNTAYQAADEQADSFRAVPLFGNYGFVEKMRRGDTIEGNYRIDSAASVFVIPPGDAQTVKNAEDYNFMVKNAMSHLPDGTNVPIQAFKYTDGSYTLDVMVARQGGSSAINSDSSMYLIENTFEAIDENGEKISGAEAIAIDVWGGRNKATYYAVDAAMFKNYKSGDVAQFVLNDKGKVTYVRPVLYVDDPDTNVHLSLKKPVEPDDGQWNNYAEPSKVMLAGAYRKEGDSIIVNRGPKLLKSGSYTPAKEMSVLAAEEADASRLSAFMSSTYIYPITMSNVFIFDSAKNKFTEGSSGDIVDYVSDSQNYSTMMLFTWWGGVRCAVIYQ